MELPKHGANPQHVYAQLEMEQPARLLDFSENVNPAGPPETVLKIWGDLVEKLNVYPDPEGEPFVSAAAKFHGVEKENVFAGNGAAELLALVAERYRGKRAIIVHPTFSEYEATLQAKNVELVRIFSEEVTGFTLPINEIMTAMQSASVLYLCTPNNPTGIMPERADVLKIIQHGMEVHCEVLLDEAFIDFVDESLSFIREIATYPNVLVVRSMTKMYAIPGIRLGYVVASKTVISGIKVLAPHWNVNGVAAQIGLICLREKSYREQAIRHSVQEREKLAAFLTSNGCTVTDSVVNFISFKLDVGRDASKLYKDLLMRGIVLRHTENFSGMDGRWFRVGMKNRAMMAELEKGLVQWFAEN
ncbi:pyridoxal phosphate-dependent aminotransferase [Sporosarcina sp. G11-34]|uniref:pyridoxal phosphate-dependent aminotransferase n=1 Tax=Sporosarcina sp. G11-34 TaxID=2849605 RepID=UPI0022A926CA|nr:aminotransferase class I/II-fold pyridoxal phosphate-dependent enzyme [Sporosarcina sp. G11-34]MCZ2257497.1 aminotransferase class I/II-fold pyridoxal phosphate-dependent enzyme [Sporosarcina sp. G11-34]